MAPRGFDTTSFFERPGIKRCRDSFKICIRSWIGLGTKTEFDVDGYIDRRKTMMDCDVDSYFLCVLHRRV